MDETTLREENQFMDEPGASGWRGGGRALMADGWRMARGAVVLSASMVLAACGASTNNSVDHNEAVPTPSNPGTVTGIVGTTQTLTVTFTSSDGAAITDLSVGSNTTYADGWRGPAGFTCLTVTTGSGCVLTLTFAPTAVVIDTLNIYYAYTDNAGQLNPAVVVIPYQSTSGNNVNGTVSPTGQITAVAGASQAVNVTFDTDDGKAASHLTVTSDLTALPAGWSSTASSFGCASVSTGNGCQLPLSFAPSGPGSGTLALNFSYTNGGGAAKTGTVSIAYATTTHDNVAASVSPSGQITSVLNTPVALSVTFTTDDGKAASALSITGGLTTLPSGWSYNGGSTFACASVSTGSGCTLILGYDPSAVVSGTLSLSYGYDDDAGTAKTGTVNISYTATTDDSVVATAAPSGQVTARIGASQGVTLTFTTNDGYPATALTVTSALSALPAGWSSTAQSFSCATLSTGNGCQLPLTYAPSATGSGTLSLSYSYTNDAGVASTGTASIPYAGTLDDNVTGTVSPSGQIASVGGGNVPVTVTFDTDDGSTATGLTLTTALSTLPIDWSSTAQSFTCASVSTGNGCQLPLLFVPSFPTTGTLALGYAYTTAAGVAATGTVSIPYAFTEHDNVLNTVSPSGQINAVVNSGTQAVNVTFRTDDGAVASGLSITSGLSSLPAGWSGAGSFTCSAVSLGNGCQLTLSYAPTAYGSGTLSLGYGYTDNAGSAKTGTVSIPYAATTHDNVTGTVSPSGTVSVATNGSQAVTVTFTTDDQNPASNLTVTSGLGVFPSGWTGPGQFTCSGVSIGTGCHLSLTYAPIAAATGTLTLNYGYDDDSGSYKTGTVSIPYSAVPHAYVADRNNGVYLCGINGDGTLSNCNVTGSVPSATGIAFSGSYAYVATYSVGQVDKCSVASDGTLSACASTGSNFSDPLHLSVNGGYLYAANIGGGVTYCAISQTDGTLSNCAATASSISGGIAGVSVGTTYAYVAAFGGNVYECTVNGGSLGGCSATGGLSGALDITTFNGYAFDAISSTPSVCSIGGAGALTNCANSVVLPNGAYSYGVSASGSYAYFATATHVYVCTASGTSLSGCAVSDGGASFLDDLGVSIH